MASARSSELKVDPQLAEQITPEHRMIFRERKPGRSNHNRGDSSLDGSVSPRGLSIQFPGSPNLISFTFPPNESAARPEGPEGTETTGRPSKPRDSISGDLASDLRQIQRELNWLARTENMKLTHGALPRPDTPPKEMRRWSSVSDDSNETFVDDDSLFSDGNYSPQGVPDRLKVLGAEFDLRNAVVQRLAELRDQRSQFGDIRSALKQLAKDYVQLARAILHADAHSKALCVSVLILCAALLKVFF